MTTFPRLSFAARTALIAVSAALALAAPGVAAAAKRPLPAKPQADRSTILVKFAAPAAAGSEVAQAGDKALGQIPLARVEVVKIQPGETVAQKVAEYDARPDVVYAEPNYLLRPSALVPNDASLADQWALTSIHATDGWAIFPGSFGAGGGVKVAVVDTGVYAGHPDLAGKVLLSDGAGCLASGFICSSSTSSKDDVGHGTHVAGILGAVANNGQGISGLAVDSQVIPVKVCFDTGCPNASIASGIAWAVAKGARVINLSLGGPGYSATICNAVAAATARGVLVVAAAGNDGAPLPEYPAACTGAIGVAANGPDGDSAFYGNWDYPDAFISAPGGNDPSFSGGSATQVLSTVPFRMGDHSAALYEAAQGTSMAAPYVSGLAALLFSQRPSRTPADVRRIMAKTAEKVGAAFTYPVFGAYPGFYGVEYGHYARRGADPFHVCSGCTWHPYWGYGQIDVEAALTGAAPKVLTFSPAIGPVGTLVTISGEDLAGAASIGFGSGTTGTIASTISENSIRVAVPAGATNGQVTAADAGGTSTSVGVFKVTPKVTGFSASVARGASVTISGFNFTGATSVRFGAVPATSFTVDSDTQITATVPATASTGKVTVTTPTGAGTSAASFVVILPPTVRSFSPAAGPVGTTVSVTGSGMDSVDSATLGGVDVGTVTLAGSTLRFAVPAGAPASGQIVVHNAVGNSAPSVASFKVSPKVTAFAPTSAQRGASVVITGSTFTSSATVKFGATPATVVSVDSDTQITATVPATAVSGKVTVTTGSGSGASASSFVVILPPTVRSFAPATGAVGTPVTVSGTSLDSVDSATLAGLDVGAITPVSATQLRFSVPAGVPATGRIVVHNAGGDSAPSTAVFRVPPKVTGLAPASAVRNGSIVITGFNFTDATAVRFGSVVATTFSVDSDTQITATVPATATTGKVTVTTPTGTGASAASLVVILPPTVSSFSPATGTVGTTVAVSGSGMDSVDSATLGGVDVGTITLAGSTLRFTVPAGVPATGQIVVHNAVGNSAPSVASFKVLPKVTGLSVSSGPRGASVAITGSTFTPSSAVRFGAVTATSVSVDSDTQITATVPATAVTGKVTVTTANGSSASASSFVVILPPTVTTFTPTSGVVGSTVALSGTNLDAVTSATLAGVDVGTLTHVGTTQLRFTVPVGTGAGGPIAVTSAAGTATTTASFAIPLTVTGFSPLRALPGTLVTISGTGFGAAGTAYASLVEFNGVAAAPVSVGASSLTVIVPPLATTGPVRVTTIFGASAISATSFGVPEVTGFTPASGITGTTVTVTGHAFTGATGVTFGGVAATSFSVDSDTQITATVPAAAVDGPVAVVTPAGTVASGDEFDVLPPTITSFTPGSGVLGTTVTITGTGLAGVTGVTFGGVDVDPASIVVSADGTSLTVEAPAGGTIVVTTPAGTATSDTDFTAIV